MNQEIKVTGFRWLLFLSRVAFICNFFFLLAFSLQLSHWIRNEDLTAMIIIIGYVLGFIVNPLVNLFYLLLFILRKKFWLFIPSWLMTANVLFLAIQILYILYLNDTQHS